MVYFLRWLRLDCNCVIELFRVILGILQTPGDFFEDALEYTSLKGLAHVSALLKNSGLQLASSFALL